MQQSPHLPDELWERIFEFLFPIGKDLENIQNVSKRFMRITRDMRQRQEKQFSKKIKIRSVPNVKTTKLKIKNPNWPTQRQNHASTMLNGVLYIFGGFANTDTAYYDLWRFVPSLLNWERVICTRTPNPKGGALLLAYERENTLILSGMTSSIND
jgi:hypothetical protein